MIGFKSDKSVLTNIPPQSDLCVDIFRWLNVYFINSFNKPRNFETFECIMLMKLS